VESIAPTLEKLVAGSLRRASGGPLLAWPLACGSAVAARTRAREFRGGVLSVEVPDAGWRTELRHLAPQYLVAMNRYSPVSVDRIEFVVATDGGRSPK
jgi:predicted nucleic acid-binding Zn ribbon protein